MQKPMALPPENESLLLTREVGHAPHVGERLTGLPIDLLIQSVSRLRVLALLYAFVFFLVELIPELLFQEGRARMLGSFVFWGPGVISIAIALSVAALLKNGRVPLSVKVNIGLAFEVAASYGIAAAEFLDPSSLAVKAVGRGSPGLQCGRHSSPSLCQRSRAVRWRPPSARSARCRSWSGP
jgi:hypothetical protein